MKAKIPFVIFSAERAEFPADVNAWRTQSCEFQLKARGVRDFIFVQGKYKDTCETSFLVLLPQGDGDPMFTEILRLARRWGQESVLYVGADREAVLFYPGLKGTVENIQPIGAWLEASKDEAARMDAYTAYNGRYFTTRAG